MRVRTMGWVIAISGLLAAQGPAGAQEAPSGISGEDAEAVGTMRGLEARLLSARRVSLDFEITAEGALEARVRGRLQRSEEGVRLSAEGTFAGRPVVLTLEPVDGPGPAQHRYGVQADPAQGPVPAELWPAVALGLTRMGLLHNLARLTGNVAPDHAEGGFEEYVELEGMERDEEGRLAFAIRVGGGESGGATLTLDADAEPRVRRQTVRFPQGDMHVVERYTDVSISS